MRKARTAAVAVEPYVFDGKSPSWVCDRCNGDQMCQRCEREVEVRTIAVRLLCTPGTRYFLPEVAQQVHQRQTWLRKQAAINELASLIEREQIEIPDPLPMRVRQDDEAPTKVAVSIYRAISTGGRRKTKEAMERSNWS